MSAQTVERLEALRRRLGAATIDDVISGAENAFAVLARLPAEQERVVAAIFDGKTRSYRLAASTSINVRGWYDTDVALIEQAAAKSRMPLAQFAHGALITEARRVLSKAARLLRSRPKKPGVALDDSALANEADFRAAYDRIVARGGIITEHYLQKEAGKMGRFPAAKSFLDRYGIQRGVPAVPLPDIGAVVPAGGSPNASPPNVKRRSS